MNSSSTQSQPNIADFIAFRSETSRVHRAAETARAEYVGEALAAFGHRIASAYRSVGEIFAFAQQMNQAARL